jgi:formylglycine-generating enzyme required for sulfatase activity
MEKFLYITIAIAIAIVISIARICLLVFIKWVCVKLRLCTHEQKNVVLPPPEIGSKPRLFSLGKVGGKPSPRLSPLFLDSLANSMGYFFDDTQGRKRLDINNTIKATVQQAIPKLIYDPYKQIYTVLVLEDAFAKPLRWNPIAKELVDGLLLRGISVLYGKCYGSLNQFSTPQGQLYHLKDLEWEAHFYFLLIFSDGKILNYYRDRSTLKALSNWPKVAWMELRELRSWDESAALPSHFGLPIYPATSEGLLQVIGGFLNEDDTRPEDFQYRAINARGIPPRLGSNLAAYVEVLLEDALLWAQCCAILQPVSLGLADALRRAFFPELPAARIERLFILPNTTETVNGLYFSKPVLGVLRAGFQRRCSKSKQEQVLQFILKKLEEVEPTDEESLAHLAWEWRWQRVNLELNPDDALQRLEQLAKTPLGDAIRAELENISLPPENGLITHNPELIPLRLRFKSKVALQRLQHLTGRNLLEESEQSLPVITLSKRWKTFRDKLKDGGKGPEMVWVPAGRFRMGDIQGEGRDNEQPVHSVYVSSFAMGRYPVTFAEYDRFAEATGRKKPHDDGKGRGNRPVIGVSWFDATDYTKWLSQQTGKYYSLPTEVEWEYAARAGTETKYWWGDDIGTNRANCFDSGSRFSGEKTAPVGSFKPNLFGLYDTVGNVWEWTCSEYEEKYRGKETKSISKNNAKNNEKTKIVLRGGSYHKKDDEKKIYSRLTYRGKTEPSKSFDNAGFRIVRIYTVNTEN